MSGATGMAIDPTLLWQQTRGGMQQQQGENSSKPQDVKQEEQPVQLQEQEQEDTGDAVMEQAASTPSASAAAPTVATNGRLPSPDSKPDIPLPPAIDLQDDAELAAFLAKMEDYEPILPDSVTRFYLEKAGFQSSDDRVTRMLGLAAQKFVSDVARDAYAFARTRTTAGPGRGAATGNLQGPSAKSKDRTRTVLTMEDLSAALHEYGVEASRAPYYR